MIIVSHPLKRLLLGVMAICCLLVAVAGAAASEYRLGVALGLSGTGGPYCKQALEGAELAVNEINSDGGLLDRSAIKIFIRDTQTRPDVARKQVAALIADHNVQTVIGTYSSACALAIKPLCQKGRVLHIAPISNSENITKIDPSPFTFSVVPNTYMMAKAVVLGVAELAREKGWQRYATVASDYAWGRSSQEIQVDLLQAAAPELTLVATYWPRLGQNRFNSFIVDIMRQKPDFLLTSIAGADNAFWMRDCRDYRLCNSIATPGGLISVTELIKNATSLRRGMYGRCRAPFFAHMDTAAMRTFVDRYRSKFGRYPSDWAVLLYDAVHILRQGVEKAGTTGTEAVREALHGMRVDTTRGQFYFRKIDNQLSCGAYFGHVADDPAYPFPIYGGLKAFAGQDIWRPEAEIQAARSQ